MLCRYRRDPSPDRREELIRYFMPMARSVAFKYRARTESADDLIQVANLGLINAIDRFDVDRGTPFYAYAHPTILGELRRHFRDRVWAIRPPRGLQEMIMRIDAATEKLSEELGREPTVSDLAAELECEPEEVLEGIEAAHTRSASSLDQTSVNGEGETQPLIERLGREEAGFEQAEVQIAVDGVELTPREREVLRLRFEDDLTQSEIGKRIGVSQMQVSRIMREALGRLVEAVRPNPRTVETKSGASRS